MQSECSYNAVYECAARMSAKKPKLKTAVMTMRVDPQVKAAAKLAASSRSLDEVSTASGFSSAEILRRVFKRRLGVTPSQYRASFGRTRLH
jgi:transcriptional regulator GlxA family with amidase domain